MAKIRIPGNYYSVTGEKKKTVHIMNPNNGQMIGRKNSPTGDRTSNIRVEKFIDVNKNKKQDAGDIYPGQILGRIGSGDKKPKALEMTQVREHDRRGNIQVRRHFRKVN